MNWLIRIVSTLVLASCISAIPSCKKDSTSAFDPNGTKLSKVITWNSLQAGKYEYVYEFHYDNQNRVVEITQFVGEPVNSVKYFYNGNEQQPYKRVDEKSGFERYHFFDNNGRLVTDSSGPTYGTEQTLSKYSWINDKILTSKIYKTESSSIISKDSCVIINNNITEKFFFGFPPGPGMVGEIYEYDNNINPLNTLNISAVTPLSGIGGMNTPGFSKNNITHYSFRNYPDHNNTGFNEKYTITYSYKYNSAGLPVECEIGGTTVTGYIKYYYTK